MFLQSWCDMAAVSLFILSSNAEAIHILCSVGCVCHKARKGTLKGATKLYTKVIFVSATKIGESTTDILKLLFFTINLHFVKSKLSTYRKLNLPLTSRIYFVFLPLEMQKRTRTDQNIPLVFLLCLKRKDSQTFKSGSCKNLCMFFILCDNWMTLLFVQV